MGDGHLNKCKICTKNDVRDRESILLKDSKWVEKEKARQREKYHRLEYKEVHKPTPESKSEAMAKYKSKYPEKALAKNVAYRIPIKLEHRHHWSYNEEHYRDIIDITEKDHKKAHRFLVYNQETKYYRSKHTDELLDTKSKHLEYITWCLENEND